MGEAVGGPEALPPPVHEQAWWYTDDRISQVMRMVENRIKPQGMEQAEWDKAKEGGRDAEQRAIIEYFKKGGR